MSLLYKAAKIVTYTLFKTAFRLEISNAHYVPKTGPVLLVCNHQSFLDPILSGLGVPRELHFMARSSLFKNPYFRTLISNLNAFPVQRDRADIKALKEIINRLKDNNIITMFPEGTRTLDGKIHPCKGGFEVIARRAKATIVPVVIDGAFDSWPKGQKLPRPKKIRVCYGEALTPELAKEFKKDLLASELTSRLRDIQTEIRKKAKKELYDYK